MLDVIGIALLIVAVFGVIALGPWLIAALVAARRRQPDLVVVFTRRASTSGLVLGGLMIVFAAGSVIERQGRDLTAGSIGLLVAGLLLLAAGTALRRVHPRA